MQYPLENRGLERERGARIISCETGDSTLIWVPKHNGIYVVPGAGQMFLLTEIDEPIRLDQFIRFHKKMIREGIVRVTFIGKEIFVETEERAWTSGEHLWQRRMDPNDVEWSVTNFLTSK